jgi:hypothetical protein
MRIFNRHRLAMLAAMLLFAGCSSPTGPGPVTPTAAPDVTPAGARLSTAEVIRIAKAAVLRQGVDLRNFKEPDAHYEFTRKDKTWFVFFEGRVLKPGNSCSVYVNDQTRTAWFVGGE